MWRTFVSLLNTSITVLDSPLRAPINTREIVVVRYTKEQKYLQFLSFIYHWISGNREWILDNFYYFLLKSSRVNFLDKDYKKRLIIIIIIFLIYRVKEIKMCGKDVENWIDEF